MELIYLLLRELRYLVKPKKIKKYITIALIIFLLSIAYTRVFAIDNGYGLPYTTYENHTYNSIPDFPSDIQNYEYKCIVPFYNYNGGTSANNTLVLLYSNNPFTFSDEGEGGRKLIYSNNLCDLGYYYYINSSTSSWSTQNLGLWRSNTSNAHFYFFDKRDPKVFFTSHDIYYKNSDEIFCSAISAEPVKLAPFIKNESGSFEKWDFEYFILDSGDYTTLDDIYVKFYYSRDNSTWYNAETFHLNYESDYVITDNPFGHYTTNIPITEIYKNFTLRQGNYIGFEIIYNNEHDYYGGYQLTITSEQTTDIENGKIQSSIQEQTTAIQEQTTAINQTTQAIENQTNTINDTNNFLKDETVDDSTFDLPTVEVNDPTSSFFDTMFTGLYNAFTNSDDISIDVELLGQNYTINSSNFNFLTDRRFAILRLVMSSFWVYRIGMFILKDIRKILDKIKDGDIEHAVTSDIKADSV